MVNINGWPRIRIGLEPPLHVNTKIFDLIIYNALLTSNLIHQFANSNFTSDPDADYEDDDVFEIEPTLNCNGLDLSYDSENDLDSSLSLITKTIKEIKIISKKKTCSSNLVPFSKQDLTPDSNHQTLLFDSHCHLDRIYSRGFNKPVSTFYQPMGRCFTMSS